MTDAQMLYIWGRGNRGNQRWGRVSPSHLHFQNTPEGKAYADEVAQRYRKTYPDQMFAVGDCTAPHKVETRE